MDRRDALAARFDTHRDHLRGVAYRMLGTRDEADDAVQRAWLRAERADLDAVENLPGWLTRVVARVCLDMLRARRSRPDGPSPVDTDVRAARAEETGPEDKAVLAESVGLALLVVLQRLTPTERVAFVLHDLFAVPFDEIATVLDRSPVASKKLASRARARVRGAEPVEPGTLVEHRAVVEAFLRATRDGDLSTLVGLLAPDVVRRADRAAVPADAAREVRGAPGVAEETRRFARRARAAEVALVDGRPGIAVAPAGRLLLVLCFTVRHRRITEIEVIAEPARLPPVHPFVTS